MNNCRGFSILEIMVVVMIIGILFTALGITIQPHLARSRDTKRVTDMLNYLNNVIVSYERIFDVFPSNYGSGNMSTSLGYCLSELTTRDDIVALGPAGNFTFFQSGTSSPPVDPSKLTAYAPLCSIQSSYIYSQIDFGNAEQIALIAGQLETRTSGNYGTGADLNQSLKVPYLKNPIKSSIPDSATEQLYIVTALH